MAAPALLLRQLPAVMARLRGDMCAIRLVVLRAAGPLKFPPFAPAVVTAAAKWGRWWQRAPLPP